MKEKNQEPRVPDAMAQQLVLLFEQGHTIKSLADLYKLDPGYVMAVTFGLARSNVTGYSLKHCIKRNLRLGRCAKIPKTFFRQIGPKAFLLAKNEAKAELKIESKEE